jgi:hypothetical protein
MLSGCLKESAGSCAAGLCFFQAATKPGQITELGKTTFSLARTFFFTGDVDQKNRRFFSPF